MHTATQPIISLNRTGLSTGIQMPQPKRPSGLRPIRLFAALGLVVVPAAGVLATTTIDPMAPETQLMLAGGFIAFGFGSLVALATARRFDNRPLTA